MKDIQHSKKYVIFLIALTFMLVSACGGTQSNNTEPTDAPPPLPTETEAESSSVNGADIYAGLCIACHGADAKGVPGLGKDLTTSEFVASKTNEELVAFIVEGRTADHPDNTTGVNMPPSGGNPNLTQDELNAVVEYLRSFAE